LVRHATEWSICGAEFEPCWSCHRIWKLEVMYDDYAVENSESRD
jgi:hypothetical protein